jgi:hypothetical protein
MKGTIYGNGLPRGIQVKKVGKRWTRISNPVITGLSLVILSMTMCAWEKLRQWLHHPLQKMTAPSTTENDCTIHYRKWLHHPLQKMTAPSITENDCTIHYRKWLHHPLQKMTAPSITENDCTIHYRKWLHHPLHKMTAPSVTETDQILDLAGIVAF